LSLLTLFWMKCLFSTASCHLYCLSLLLSRPYWTIPLLVVPTHQWSDMLLSSFE
jgi:hypothetical protein